MLFFLILGKNIEWEWRIEFFFITHLFLISLDTQSYLSTPLPWSIHLPRGCACRSPKRHRCQSGEAADGKQDMQAGREGQGKISHSYAHRLFWPFRDEKGMARNSSPVTSTPLVISPCHCPIMYLVPLSGHNYASLPPTYLCALWTTRDSHMPADIYIYGWAKEDVRQIQYFCFWFWP